MSALDLALKRFFPCFDDPAVEARYRQAHLDQSLPSIRRALVVAALIETAFTVTDVGLNSEHPELWQRLLLMRCCVWLPLLLRRGRRRAVSGEDRGDEAMPHRESADPEYRALPVIGLVSLVAGVVASHVDPLCPVTTALLAGGGFNLVSGAFLLQIRPAK